jgi:hypothetical protein
MVAISHDNYVEGMELLSNNQKFFLEDRWGGKEEIILKDGKMIELNSRREVVDMSEYDKLKPPSNSGDSVTKTNITNYGKMIEKYGNPIYRNSVSMFFQDKEENKIWWLDVESDHVRELNIEMLAFMIASGNKK